MLCDHQAIFYQQTDALAFKNTGTKIKMSWRWAHVARILNKGVKCIQILQFNDSMIRKMKGDWNHWRMEEEEDDWMFWSRCVAVHRCDNSILSHVIEKCLYVSPDERRRQLKQEGFRKSSYFLNCIKARWITDYTPLGEGWHFGGSWSHFILRYSDDMMMLFMSHWLLFTQVWSDGPDITVITFNYGC